MKQLNEMINLFSSIFFPARRLQLLPLPGHPPSRYAEEQPYLTTEA